MQPRIHAHTHTYKLTYTQIHTRTNTHTNTHTNLCIKEWTICFYCPPLKVRKCSLTRGSCIHRRRLWGAARLPPKKTAFAHAFISFYHSLPPPTLPPPPKRAFPPIFLTSLRQFL